MRVMVPSNPMPASNRFSRWEAIMLDSSSRMIDNNLEEKYGASPETYEGKINPVTINDWEDEYVIDKVGQDESYND